MQGASSRKHDVIVAGIGGTGSMMIGQILASAGVTQYNNTLWNPSMTTARRGAPADCTVILSDNEITSPLLLRAETVLMTESSRLEAFEDRALPGGTIIMEASGKTKDVERDDVTVFEVPGVETAARLGNTLARNMVILGAYIEKLKALSIESVEEEISKKFSGNDKVRELNLSAFREGIKIAADI